MIQKIPNSKFQIPKRGYTLIELIIAVGLFALIMTLASGAYLVMIGINRQVQGIATGIDNLSFALETMTRTIRTGTDYSCGGGGSNCPVGASSFSITNSSGATVTYSLSASAIQQTVGGTTVALTDPSVIISSLMFYSPLNSSKTTQQNDYQQPRVTITISGSVSSGPGKTETFAVETGATMRGSDI
ncbi:MAG: prepilin-type N-terminal cleavage/methylation domain-containing protein [Patescibacteria group bacterium]